MNPFCLATINLSGLTRCLLYDGEFPLTVSEFKSWILRNHFPQFQNSLLEEFYILSETCVKHDEDVISEGQTYHLLPRLVGGKGGFGSMLRAIGAQIEKTTNREACRDLSGRRMRDINNEKQLKDWMSKQKDRERERARRREEKAARRRAEPQHKFEDRLYDQQREKVSQDLDDALQQGLKRAKSSTATSSSIALTTAKKRKAEDSLQKQWHWIGVTEDSSPSPSSDGSEDNDDVTAGAHACPGVLALPTPDEAVCPGLLPLPTPDEAAFPSLLPLPTPVEAACPGLLHLPTPDEAACPGLLPLPTPDEAACPSFLPHPTPDAAESGASTSATSDHEFCPPHSLEHTTGSDSQSSLLGSLPSSTTKIAHSSSESSESSSEEKILDLMTVLETANCSEDLECLGLEKLKLALLDKGLKCGGTLAERAQRIFAVRGLSPDQIDPSFFAKPTKGKGNK